jgi:hypothetical protein
MQIGYINTQSQHVTLILDQHRQDQNPLSLPPLVLYFNPYILHKLDFYPYFFTQMSSSFFIFTKDT